MGTWSVVMIASAASKHASLPCESCFDRAFEARWQPVHRQVDADHAGRRDDRPGSAAHAEQRRGLARRRARVAHRRARRCTRSRSPRCTTTARIASPSNSRCSSADEQRRGLDLVGRDHSRADVRPSSAISARSLLRFLIPACTPAKRTPGTAPRPPRTSMSRIRSVVQPTRVRASSPRLLRKPEHDVHVLHGLPAAPLPRLSIALRTCDDAVAHPRRASARGCVFATADDTVRAPPSKTCTNGLSAYARA